jgi:hypothetical protein
VNRSHAADHGIFRVVVVDDDGDDVSAAAAATADVLAACGLGEGLGEGLGSVEGAAEGLGEMTTAALVELMVRVTPVQ